MYYNKHNNYCAKAHFGWKYVSHTNKRLGSKIFKNLQTAQNQRSPQVPCRYASERANGVPFKGNRSPSKATGRGKMEAIRITKQGTATPMRSGAAQPDYLPRRDFIHQAISELDKTPSPLRSA